MPTIERIGPTVSTGVDLTDRTRYRKAASSWNADPQRTSILIPMVGGPPVLVRHQNDSTPRDWQILCVRAAGYQEKLDDFAAIVTQLNAANAYSLGTSVTPIYWWEQYGNQTAVRQYLIIRGWLDERTRAAGGVNLRVVGSLHFETRAAPGA